MALRWAVIFPWRGSGFCTGLFSVTAQGLALPAYWSDPMSNQITSDISANDVPALQVASAPKYQRKTSKAVKPKTTKTEAVISLLRHKNGASLGDLQSVTGWQAHSVRGFLSGTVKKKLNLLLSSQLTAKGERRYHIAKA
jgi:hypothetical protein